MDDSVGIGFAGVAGFTMLFMVALYVAMIAFCVYMYMRVARQAGYPKWYGALAFIPLVNIVVLCMFVFTEWPVTRELRELRARAGGQGYNGPGGYTAPHYGGQGSSAPSYGGPAYGAQPFGEVPTQAQPQMFQTPPPAPGAGPDLGKAPGSPYGTPPTY